MTVFKLFLGGDARHVGYRHSRIADNSNPLVRYAGHLPNRHFVVPFEYDGASGEWTRFREMEGHFATGDIVHTHLLSADSRVDALVVHNKKQAGARDEKGAITTAGKVKFGLYDGETLVDETEEIDLSVIGRTVLEFGKAVNAKNSTKKDSDGDGKVTKKDTATTAITSLGAYLGSNGSIRMTVVDGSGIDGACISAFVEVVDFLDVRGCTCGEPACDSTYPEPECM